MSEKFLHIICANSMRNTIDARLRMATYAIRNHKIASIDLLRQVNHVTTPKPCFDANSAYYTRVTMGSTPKNFRRQNSAKIRCRINADGEWYLHVLLCYLVHTLRVENVQPTPWKPRI